MNKLVTAVRAIVKQSFDESDVRFSGMIWYYNTNLLPCSKIGLDLVKKYGGDATAVELAYLPHDIGLLRGGSQKHEVTSANLAGKLLKRLGVKNPKIVKLVKTAIKATAFEVKPTTIKAKIVRTADALAHLTTLYHFRKAYKY